MPKTHFILDEAASLGQMNCITDALDKYRAYDICCQLYYQAPPQLKECFPNGQDQTVLANVTQIYFGINDQCADYISSRLGEETIVVESGGTSTSYSSQTSMQGPSHGESTSSNQNWSQMGRRLLKPEEIYALDERIAITFVAGMPPILTRLERYYETRYQPVRFARLRVALKTLQMLTVATLLLAVMILTLGGTIDVRELERNFSGAGKPGAATQGRTPATRHSRHNGTGVRPVQRERLRALRSRPVHTQR